MFLLYNSIPFRLSYLIRFRMKFICRYLLGRNTLIVPDACKSWDHKEDQNLLVNIPFLFVPYFSPLINSLFWQSSALSLVGWIDRSHLSLYRLDRGSLVTLALSRTGMMRFFLGSPTMHRASSFMCSLMDLLRSFAFPSCLHKGPTTSHFYLSCRNVLILGAHKFPAFHSCALCSSGLLHFLLSWVWKNEVAALTMFLCSKVSHEKLRFCLLDCLFITEGLRVL